MSAAVINLNPDLKRLRDEGYELEIRDAFAIVRNIPYLDHNLSVQRGVLVSNLGMNGSVVKYDNQHTIYFHGSMPYRANGSPLNAIFLNSQNTTIAGVQVDMMFSNKPQGNYTDYYHKFTRYIQLLSAEAQAVDPTATAATFRKVAPDWHGVFNYADTNASRANITGLSDKFVDQRVGIVGLGGTGTYILDMVAKTPVKEIHLYDGDVFCQHNAFRAPGAAAAEIFEVQHNKTDYFQQMYSNMHRQIISHPQFIRESNMEELGELTFVFLAMDSGPDKQVVVDYLSSKGISFIDTGIDIQQTSNGLLGTTRSTLSESGNREAINRNVSFAVAEKGLYESNIQTAELNAFCALTAVLRWKAMVGFYRDANQMSNCVYNTIDGEFKWD